LSLRMLTGAVVPSLVAIVAWFLVSPPSFRFAWGPIFLLPTIIIAWSWMSLPRRTSSQTFAVLTVSSVIVSVTAFSVLFRSQIEARTDSGVLALGFVEIEYPVAPLPDVPTAPRTMESGLVIQEPISGDQCWANYPLCTIYMGDKIGLLGRDIADGFVTLP